MQSEITRYITDLDRIFQSGNAAEHSYRPALQRLLESTLPDLTVSRWKIFCRFFRHRRGGMELPNIREMLQRYGGDTLVLVGSGLFRLGDGLIANCRRFFEEVEKTTEPAA